MDMTLQQYMADVLHIPIEEIPVEEEPAFIFSLEEWCEHDA